MILEEDSEKTLMEDDDVFMSAGSDPQPGKKIIVMMCRGHQENIPFETYRYGSKRSSKKTSESS